MPVTSTWMTQTYAGNASTTTFAYGQPIQSIYDLSVYLTDNTGYKYAPLVSGVDYQVNGVGNSNSSTWNITYPIASGVAALPTGWTLTINLAVPLVTNTNITTITTSSGPTIQGAFDRGTLQSLSLEQQIQNISSTVVSGVSSVNGNTGAVTITAAGINAAPINSAALTGTPTAPTATAGTNTTQVATTAFVTGATNTAVNGTATDIAVFSGTNTVGGNSNLTYTQSAGVNTIQLTATSYAQIQTICTGGATVEFWANSGAGDLGTYSNHPFNILTNNVQRASFAKEGLLTINYGVKINDGGLVTNSAGTLAIAAANIVNNGLLVQTGSTASTWTLPTGTAMDTAVGSSATTGDQIQFTVSNTSSATITMAAGSGFTLGASYTVATLQSRVFTAYRTGTNTWVLY